MKFNVSEQCLFHFFLFSFFLFFGTLHRYVYFKLPKSATEIYISQKRSFFSLFFPLYLSVTKRSVLSRDKCRQGVSKIFVLPRDKSKGYIKNVGFA